MTEEISDLPWSQGLDCSIWLSDAVYQICGESMSETMEALLVNPGSFENPIESFLEAQ